jgi:unsaturated chondroitin disaccharide hydrolase
LKRRTLLITGAGVAIGAVASLIVHRPKSAAELRFKMALGERINLCINLARTKLASTIDYLDSYAYRGIIYPYFTHPERSDFNLLNWQRKNNHPISGTWKLEEADFWAAGVFPALLWRIAALETDPLDRAVWAAAAKKWGDPLKEVSLENKDIALNNLLVFAPWFESGQGKEKQQALEIVLKGARQLAKPFQDGKGSYHTDIGTFGWLRRADRTDNQEHWQVFIDHTINVEQLLWASQYTSDPKEAKDWQEKALSHIRTIRRTFGANRRPGKTGTWQIGYFDHNVNSPTYTNFLFNEGKQGWRDDSTWSRGQAWFIYSATTAYIYTGDPDMLMIAKDAINYYLENLPDRLPGNKRRAGDFIPPWDFDYALQKNPNTEKDSSAASIAVAGMIRLVKVLPSSDPNYQTYRQAIDNTLFNLTSFEYFPDETAIEMSLLRHGCYHHPEAIQTGEIYDTGLIWGDFFLINALAEYKDLLP